MTEHIIIEGCKKHCKKAQRKLFELYAPVLRGIAFRYSKNREDAEDILQDSFIKILTKIHTYNNQGSFEGWLKRIVVNAALNNYKKISKNYHYDLNEEIEEQPGSNNEPQNAREIIESGAFTNEEVLETVSTIPEGYKIIFNGSSL